MSEAPFLSTASSPIATDLDPLIVTSPIQRSGTTLLQRLLCSSSNSLIYGEKVAQDLEFFLNIYAYKTLEYSKFHEKHQGNLEKVLRGSVNDWIFDLTPDVDGYLTALQKAAFAGATYCRDFALKSGRSIWGFKYPAWNPIFVELLHTWMPKSRFIYILRDILPALKSAKAQHMIDSEQELRKLCQSWIEGMTYCQQLSSNSSSLIIHYEDLLQKPDETISLIATFSGAQNIDSSVLKNKINSWTGQNFGTQIYDGYIPPVELTDKELKIVEELTMPFRTASTQIESAANNKETMVHV